MFTTGFPYMVFQPSFYLEHSGSYTWQCSPSKQVSLSSTALYPITYTDFCVWGCFCLAFCFKILFHWNSKLCWESTVLHELPDLNSNPSQFIQYMKLEDMIAVPKYLYHPAISIKQEEVTARRSKVLKSHFSKLKHNTYCPWHFGSLALYAHWSIQEK